MAEQTLTVDPARIRSVIASSSHAQLIQMIEEGFRDYAAGKVVVPPVGYLPFTNPDADVHIKYGYITGDEYYVIKIASGFYENPKIGIPSSNGMMLIFSQKTGAPLGVLLDEGYLTDVRTAVAGAVAARVLAPTTMSCIGIVGTGMQARMQLEYLQTVTPCRKVMVWGRSAEKLSSFCNDPTLKEFSITPTQDLSLLTRSCNLIVTTTTSREPLLRWTDVQPGTHITAMGADAAGKQELDAAILTHADRVVADSVDQCVDHGECFHAVQAGLPSNKILALGDVIAKPELRRQHDREVTVADLTGVAIQDIQITKFVYQQIKSH